MTNAEEKSIKQIYELLSLIRVENEKFRQDINNQVISVSKTVQEKHLPVLFEDEIMKAVDTSLSKAMAEAMTGYNSPLIKYAHNVVSKFQAQIELIFENVVREAIATDDFKTRVREVLLNKIAKTMISGVDGSIDKTVNLMKQDAIFRSRLTLSINTLVDEFLTKK